ncbi:MAG: DUF424 family protein [Candidatus Micrarchaeia archaeon]
MHCKRHENNGRVVFALCDKELIGKVISNGKITLDLKTYARFYIGDDIKLLEECEGKFESINAIGKKSVEFLIKKGYIKEENCKYVGDVPHVQLYKIK